MPSLPKLRLGTRASALARWQAQWVADRLTALGLAEIEMVHISTQGDQQQTGPIGNIGSSGVFTKELQRALLANEIDLAVHSLKDLPTDPVEGLSLVAVPERGPQGDVLVAARSSVTLDTLPVAAIIGTGSLRRRAQMWHVRPDLQMAELRGNVDTRLRKLQAGQYDAIVLAEAGLVRLGLAQYITQRFALSQILPAVGQGALGIEARTSDAATQAILAALDHPTTHAIVLAERSMLATLRGGCLAPVAAWCRLTGDRIQLSGAVLALHGTRRLAAEGTCPIDASAAVALGAEVAQQLLSLGAAKLIAAARRSG